MVRLIVLVIASFLGLAACQATNVTMNQPLPVSREGAPAYTPGYTLLDMLHAPRGELFVALAFSGGGKRSAAFAYGALLALRSMQVIDNGRPKPLLDEVDYIAAVSGGSFPAVHYGLYREESFRTFEAAFLKRDVNRFVYQIYLLPWNWEWLVNPLFGTNDAMALVYDRLMFNGATYADLQRRGLPMISVDATDLAGGVVFPFNQTSFDRLCSDLSSFPVSRAVAASAAFPILFTPITLVSYRSDCVGHPPPGPLATRASDTSGSALSRTAMMARNEQRQMDPAQTQFLHLMDGGIADNLALRSLSNDLMLLDESSELLQRLAPKTRRVIVINVDGQAAQDPTLGQRRVVSGLRQIISAVSGSQINAYSFETLLFADQQIAQLTQTIRRIRCAQGKIIDGHNCDDVQGALIPITLADVPDEPLRRRLQAIPTSLTIPDADVDALVAEGQRLVQTNATLLGLLADFRPRSMAACRTSQAPYRPGLQPAC